MRKGSSKNNKITYPRKCKHCDYIANNPAMYSYHNRTHKEIPLGSKCHFNCGKSAKFRNTGGKLTCTEKYQDCLGYLEELSKRTKNSWLDSLDRKEKTKESLRRRLHNDKTVLKQMKTKREKFGIITKEDARDYNHYAAYIRRRARKWAKSNGHKLGLLTYHVDHKFSIFDSWHANLSEDIVNHPKNLQIMSAKENSAKGPNSSISLAELLSYSKKIN